MFRFSPEDQQFPRIADFYSGKSVLITGAAGFIGSILLETLLRCCPGIKTIYILLRSKKNVEPDVRKEQIFNRKIFGKFKEETPELLDKVRVIHGDISLPNLGMNGDDEQQLVEEVSFVFHCAAIISFTKPLKFVLLHNVLGLNSIIELCRRMRKFEALVYTSTCYSNCNHINLTLKEEVLRLPFRAEEFIDVLKNDDDKRLEEMYAHCKPDWPNSYPFSKCLAENVIMDTASDLPVIIVRPSICINTWKHPMPGYVEGNFGLTALTLGVGKGFIKVGYGNPNSKMNMVPVDIVSNTLVVAAWSVGTKRCMSPMVVNCTATEKLYIPVSEYIEVLSEFSHKFPLPQSFAEYTTFILVPNRYLYYIVAAYHHYLPAVVLDGILKMLGKKPRIYSLYCFYDKVMSSINFFGSNSFEFERNNIEYLDKLIHPQDRNYLALDFKDATFLEVTMKVPEISPFFDWKVDKKSPSERQKVKYRRHIFIKGVQWMFLISSSLFIYWMFSLIFL